MSCRYNPPFITQNGGTALTISSFNGHHKVVELHLGAGANPDLQDKVRTGRDIALFPGVEEGGKRAPGTHCLRMRVIIANAMWQN